MTLVARVRHTVSALVASVATGCLSSLALASTPAAEDIRDIRGPIAIPIWWHWPLAIGVATVLATGIVLAVRWWQRRRPTLSAVELARQALERALAEAQAGRAHAWAEIVAVTVRGALASRVGPAILPQTTTEMATADWTKPPMDLVLDTTHILEILETCDVARFAKASFDPNALIASTAVARDVTERLYAPPPRSATRVPVVAQTVPQ